MPRNEKPVYNKNGERMYHAEGHPVYWLRNRPGVVWCKLGCSEIAPSFPLFSGPRMKSPGRPKPFEPRRASPDELDDDDQRDSPRDPLIPERPIWFTHARHELYGLVFIYLGRRRTPRDVQTQLKVEIEKLAVLVARVPTIVARVKEPEPISISQASEQFRTYLRELVPTLDEAAYPSKPWFTIPPSPWEIIDQVDADRMMRDLPPVQWWELDCETPEEEQAKQTWITEHPAEVDEIKSSRAKKFSDCSRRLREAAKKARPHAELPCRECADGELVPVSGHPAWEYACNRCGAVVDRSEGKYAHIPE